MEPKISVIIPAYNEVDNLDKLLPSLLKAKNIEVIIAASGDQDATKLNSDSRVKLTEGGHRALALNNGAKIAKGDILYFLHADSVLPDNWDDIIRKFLNSKHQLGAFRMKFDQPNLMLKIYSWVTRFNWAWIRFGDQSLFVVKELFDKIGGYDTSLKIMEDADIVQRAKHHSKIVITNATITTSARKYQKYGYYKLQAIYNLIVLMYYLGFKQKALLKIKDRFLKY